MQWDGTLTYDHPVFILTEERFTLARVFYAFSLFAFFVRLMYIFSFSIVLGPKLIMIRRMVTNDLLPFLMLLFVILIGYGVSVSALSYPNGYYASIFQRMSPGKIIYEFMMTSYFQMLGDFGLNILEGEGQSFADNFALESKLVKWEYMKAQGILRAQADSEFGARRIGANGPRLTTVLRGRAQAGGGGTHGVTRGPAGREEGHTGSQMLEGLSNLLGTDSEFIEGRFEALQTCYSKIAGLEDRMEKIGTLMRKLATTVTTISHMQTRILASLEPGQGRRLVGQGKSKRHPKTTEITNQLIADVIREAVKGLSKHCTDINEKIEEKLRIEGLCIKAVMTYPKPPCTQLDVVTPLPKMPPSRRPDAIPPSGQVFERLIGSHRLWRISPFNFERRPGMRVNIPDEKIDWKVVYPDYRPFTITGERLAYPYPEIEDGPQMQVALDMLFKYFTASLLNTFT
ncbi:unnamed protein product [Dibothriocephalus latus]|uniref:Ion transport domain-containing protein n=1 Tax=Dibothriocephalus latus TaxID=60516 RepID=A0A3P7LGD7_DIBLA|nr:unnamed protein product [Dibothriocephalus latus]